MQNIALIELTRTKPITGKVNRKYKPLYLEYPIPDALAYILNTHAQIRDNQNLKQEIQDCIADIFDIDLEKKINALTISFIDSKEDTLISSFIYKINLKRKTVKLESIIDWTSIDEKIHVVSN